MRQFSNDELRAMTLADAKAELGNRVYDACWLLEQLEGVGKVGFNGHHLMQSVAAFATNLLEGQWTVGDQDIRCYQLSDGRRVLEATDVDAAEA